MVGFAQSHHYVRMVAVWGAPTGPTSVTRLVKPRPTHLATPRHNAASQPRLLTVATPRHTRHIPLSPIAYCNSQARPSDSRRLYGLVQILIAADTYAPIPYPSY
jgi:hypothetical protein